MKPKQFAQGVLEADSEVPGTQTLKRTLSTFEISEKQLTTKAHHDWNNHRDYRKYNPSKHSIMCCGWTDWHDHKDS